MTVIKLYSVRFLAIGLFIGLIVVWVASNPASGNSSVPVEEDKGQLSTREIHYELNLKDPVQPETPSQAYSIQLSLDDQGFPQEYRLFLQTHVCLDRVCKRLEVILFWDALGRYSHLEHPEKIPLTKSSHEEFEPKDYDQLNAILKNKKSILGTHPLSFFVIQPKANAEEIDAMTSATPQAVQDAVVPSAAYTSWVLWHWVNGEIVDQLRALTLSHCDSEYLVYCLQLEDPQFIEFALKQILEGNAFDSKIQEACFQTLETSDRANSQLALQIVTTKSSNKDELNRRLIKLIGTQRGSSELILNYFKNLSEAPPTLWDQMADQLHQISAYQDVNAVLNLLESRNGNSESIRVAVASLLDRKNRFIVRRVQEFLEN